MKRFFGQSPQNDNGRYAKTLCHPEQHEQRMKASAYPFNASAYSEGSQPRVSQNDSMPKAAFTLAEVLIALAIIGVVAAMTIPTLITKYQQKVLKTQFMNKYALLQQQLLYAKNDFGANLRKYCVSYDDDKRVYTNSAACYDIFSKYFKVIGSCTYKTTPLTYNKSSDAYIDIGGSATPRYLLSDGSCYDVTVNSLQLGFSVDINGSEKGPNALGHDIFSFWVDENDYLTPIKMKSYLSDEDVEESIADCQKMSCFAGVYQRGYPCTLNSNQKGNGLGCSWYALNDICPDDDTKGYWECLPK